MTRKMSKRLVIDASITCAAGNKKDPISKNCNLFLKSILTICHRVVLYEDLNKEYDKHTSSHGSTWLTEMKSKGKYKKLETLEGIDRVKEIIKTNVPYGNKRTAMLKDAHLICAAINTDMIITALDNEARKHFAELSKVYKEIASVIWVNPCVENEEPLNWLKQGAKKERSRRLCNYLNQ